VYILTKIANYFSENTNKVFTKTSPYPEIHTTTDSMFSVATVTSSPSDYTEDVTTEGEARGQLVTDEPLNTTSIESPLLPYNITEVEEDAIKVATALPYLGYEIAKDNVTASK